MIRLWTSLSSYSSMWKRRRKVIGIISFASTPEPCSTENAYRLELRILSVNLHGYVFPLIFSEHTINRLLCPQIQLELNSTIFNFLLTSGFKNVPGYDWSLINVEPFIVNNLLWNWNISKPLLSDFRAQIRAAKTE